MGGATHRGRDRITIRLPEDLIDDIERIAQRELTPVAVLLRRWINERVAREDDGGARGGDGPT